MTDSTDVQLAVAIAEIERLRARILELEAAAALTHGTLAKPTEDESVVITANHPPSAPPHIGHTIKWPTRTGNDDE